MKTQKVYTFLKSLGSVPPIIYFTIVETIVIIIFVSNFMLTSHAPFLEFHWTAVSIIGIVSVIFLNFVVIFCLLFSWLFFFLLFCLLGYLSEGVNEKMYKFFEKITIGLSFSLAFLIGVKIQKKYREHISSMFFS